MSLYLSSVSLLSLKCVFISSRTTHHRSPFVQVCLYISKLCLRLYQKCVSCACYEPPCQRLPVPLQVCFCIFSYNCVSLSSKCVSLVSQPCLYLVTNHTCLYFVTNHTSTFTTPASVYLHCLCCVSLSFKCVSPSLQCATISVTNHVSTSIASLYLSIMSLCLPIVSLTCISLSLFHIHMHAHSLSPRQPPPPSSPSPPCRSVCQSIYRSICLLVCLRRCMCGCMCVRARAHTCV